MPQRARACSPVPIWAERQAWRDRLAALPQPLCGCPAGIGQPHRPISNITMTPGREDRRETWTKAAAANNAEGRPVSKTTSVSLLWHRYLSSANPSSDWLDVRMRSECRPRARPPGSPDLQCHCFCSGSFDQTVKGDPRAELVGGSEADVVVNGIERPTFVPTAFW